MMLSLPPELEAMTMWVCLVRMSSAGVPLMAPFAVLKYMPIGSAGAMLKVVDARSSAAFERVACSK
jgi:hypothetical protein